MKNSSTNHMSNPYKKQRRSLSIRFLLIIFILSCTTIAFLRTPKVDLNKISKKCSSITSSTSVNDPNNKPKEEWNKPIWVAMLTNSFPDDIHRSLINSLTRLNTGGKSFYASVKNNLRHCQGATETATCATGDLPPTKYKGIFNERYIMILRSPKTVFPSMSNFKDNKYHNIVGQSPIEHWRELRDAWFDPMMDGWVDQILNWRKQDGYSAGLYVVYEDLFDVKRGPTVVKDIGKLLNSTGFDVAMDDNDLFSCTWFNSIGQERIEFYNNNNQYEFNDYLPGFTKEQKTIMLSKLDGLMKEIGDSDSVSDKELMSILKRYRDDIHYNIVIDRKAAKSTQEKSGE